MEENVDYKRIEQAIQYLVEAQKRQPSLEEVAEQIHLSPYHFQRMFTHWAGISPKKFLQYLTVDFLKSRLPHTANLHEAAESAGLSTPSRVHDLFVTLEGMTPQAYKQQGAQLRIRYGFHASPFGTCLIGCTDRGICSLEFVEAGEEAQALTDLQAKWAASTLIEHTERTQAYAAMIFGLEAARQPIPLLLKGTNFQLKVWEALLKIPQGQLSTYQHLATQIGNARAARAVGTAIGNNPIAYLIPCHRVIRREGKIGQYHWGHARKCSLIGWEMARHAPAALLSSDRGRPRSPSAAKPQ